jgi:PAS domain S-box-containing protein
VHAQDGRVADTLERLVQRVEPAQRRELQAAMDACIVQGEAFDLEVPLLAGVNPLMWIRLIGEPHRDAAGRISRVQGTAQDITERRLAAERARELGARLAATLDSVSDAFLTLNQDGTFTYVNPEAERLLGRPRGDLLGRELFQEFPGLQGSRFEREFRRAVAAGATVEFEEFAPSLQRWLKVKAYASPQGLAVYFRDITDTHSVQQALTDSQEELRHLFENAIDGVLYTGQDGRVLRANPAACAMLGRPESDLRGTSFAALVRGGDLALARLWEQRRMTGRVTGQISLACGEGSGLPADLSSAEYAAADGSVRAFVVLRDISRRVHAEQQLLQLNIELGERVLRRTAELEAANAELKTLAHSLAHDLQSPVAAIDAFSELLEEVLPQPLPDRGAHYLGRIRAAARKTSEYAQGLLALARVSQATLSPQKVDLGAIAADLLTQMAERDSDRQVQWQVQSGMVAMGDATLLRIALDNLLGNAWKFTRDRRPARIEVACDTDAAGQKVYRVRDNGAGFDMAHAHKLFGNFQRLHTAQEFPGTGLGLANVLRIVGRHGGRVWAEGVEGEGACFYFTLAASPAGPSVK